MATQHPWKINRAVVPCGFVDGGTCKPCSREVAGVLDRPDGRRSAVYTGRRHAAYGSHVADEKTVLQRAILAVLHSLVDDRWIALARNRDQVHIRDLVERIQTGANDRVVGSGGAYEIFRFRRGAITSSAQRNRRTIGRAGGEIRCCFK